jgi:hypothetical protein
MKFTQIPANATPATTDYIIGHTAAGVDDKITIAQLASIVSANLGSSVMKFIGATSANGAGAVIPGGVYTTYLTITGPSNGGRVLVKGNANLKDGNSGATRTGHIRIRCDGVVVGNSDVSWQTVNSAQWLGTVSTMESHTPSAGSHTWTFEIQADFSSASLIFVSQLEVVQVLP